VTNTTEIKFNKKTLGPLIIVIIVVMIILLYVVYFTDEVKDKWVKIFHAFGTVYLIYYMYGSSKEGDLWNKLTPEQQEEILLSLDESNDPNNLISNEEVKKNHKKWL